MLKPKHTPRGFPNKRVRPIAFRLKKNGKKPPVQVPTSSIRGEMKVRPTENAQITKATADLQRLPPSARLKTATTHGVLSICPATSPNGHRRITVSKERRIFAPSKADHGWTVRRNYAFPISAISTVKTDMPMSASV